MGIRRKVKEWLKRYLPAEIISTLATVAAGVWAQQHGYSMLGTALAGTWVGTCSYYVYIFIADLRRSLQLHRQQARPYTAGSLWIDVRSLIAEFGIAELLDSFLFRPAFMYYIPLLMGHLLSGMVVAKLCGDITFYIPAIIGYELNKKHRSRSGIS